MIKLKKIEFDSELVRETTFSVESLGMFKNSMELQKNAPNEYCIIWNYGEDAPDEDETVIGILLDGNELIDYDGVFSLPKQAIELLEKCGINADYAKD